MTEGDPEKASLASLMNLMHISRLHFLIMGPVLKHAWGVTPTVRPCNGHVEKMVTNHAPVEGAVLD